MNSVTTRKSGNVATITLHRGKVNALNQATVEALGREIEELGRDDSVRSIILTGQGKFFSFGFDVPEFLSYAKEKFINYLTQFTDLYTRLFQFPKPVIAALNGHTIAGGCMLALACDHRLMVAERAKISLNEITFGSSVFAGSVEMLQYWVGHRNAQSILYSGAMYTAEEAFRLGLIDQVSSGTDLVKDAVAVSEGFARMDPVAFRSIKALARGSIVEKMRRRERASIQEFADIWYSEATWSRLKDIHIRE